MVCIYFWLLWSGLITSTVQHVYSVSKPFGIVGVRFFIRHSPCLTWTFLLHYRHAVAVRRLCELVCMFVVKHNTTISGGNCMTRRHPVSITVNRLCELVCMFVVKHNTTTSGGNCMTRRHPASITIMQSARWQFGTAQPKPTSYH